MPNIINISQILIKRGNTAAASNYVGPLGELLVDTGLETIRLQDGSTPGGMSTLVNTQQLSNVIVAIEGIQSNTANISAILANIHGANISGITSNVAILQQQLSANGIATIGGLLVGNIGFTSNSYIWSVEDSQIQFSANGYNDQSGIFLNNQNVAVMYANTQLQLVAGSTSSGTTWIFNPSGNLTLPGNVIFADNTVQSTAYQGPAGQTSFATVANVTTANVALKGYVDSKIALLANAPAILDTLGQIATAIQNDEGNIGTILTSITATNANVAAANVAWQANAVTQLSQINAANAAIVTANLAVVAYVNAQDALLQSGITGANAAIVTANTAMKGYVDAVTTAWTSNAATQQTLINTINANITAANSTIATLQSNIGSFYTYANLTYGTSSYANANVAAYLVANPQAGTYSNTNVAGYLAGNITSGNVTSTYFIGNGSKLTNVTAQYLGAGQVTGGYNSGLNAGYITLAAAGLIQSASYALTLATSSSYPGSNNINISPGTGGNVILQGNIVAAGNTYYGAGVVTTGNITSGNVFASGFFYANGTPFTSSNYGNTQVAAYLVANPQTGTYSNTNVASYIGATTFSAISSSVLNSVGQINGTAVYIQTNGSHNFYFDSTGNLVLPSGGAINYANGASILTGISAGAGTYSNTNVAAYLTTQTFYSNTNAAAYLTTATINTTGNITAGNLTTAGTYYVANITTTGAYGNITGANVISANTLQVSNGIFWANGTAWSSTSGSGTTYSNANVTAYLAAGTDGTILGLVANTTAANTTITALQANIGSFYTYANSTYTGGGGGTTYSNANVVSMLAANSVVYIGNVGNVATYPLQSNITQIFIGNSATLTSGGGANAGTTYLMDNIYFGANGATYSRNTQTGAYVMGIGGSTGFTFSGTTGAITGNTYQALGSYAQLNSSGFTTYNSIGITSAGVLTGAGVTSTNGLTLNTLGTITTNQSSAAIFNGTATTISMGGAATTINLGTTTAAAASNVFVANAVGTSNGNLTVRAFGTYNQLSTYTGAGGYNSPPYNNQSLTGGSGTGMTASYGATGGYPNSYVVTNPGTGYKNGDILTLPGGLGATVILTNYNPNRVSSSLLTGLADYVFGLDGNLALPANVNIISNGSIILSSVGGSANITVGNVISNNHLFANGVNILNSITTVSNGTSSLSFATSGGNAVVQIGGVQTATIGQSQLNITGNIIATANIVASNIMATQYGNSIGTTATYSGNVTANTVNIGTVNINSATGNYNVLNISGAALSPYGTPQTWKFFTNNTTLGSVGSWIAFPDSSLQTTAYPGSIVGGLQTLSLTGNLTTGSYVNAITGNIVGNLTAGNIIGNQYGNSIGTTAAYTGNVSANYFVGNGAALTGISTVGNIYGTQPNVTLVSGSYSYVFDTAGNLTMPVNGDLVMNTGGTIGTVTGTNANITVNPDGTGQFVVTSITPAWFGNTVTVLGNVNAGNIIGTQYGNSIGTSATFSGNVTAGNLVTSGYGQFTGAFNESTTISGVFVGNSGTAGAQSPRVGFFNGNTTQNWEIDNYNGAFRWFTPGVTRMNLDGNTSQLSVYGNISSTGNIIATGSSGPKTRFLWDTWQANSTSALSSFTPSGTIGGNATWDSTQAYGLKLTTNTTSQSGYINWNSSTINYNYDMVITASIAASGGSGADGQWIYFGSNAAITGNPGNTNTYGGIAVMNHYYSSASQFEVYVNSTQTNIPYIGNGNYVTSGVTLWNASYTSFYNLTLKIRKIQNGNRMLEVYLNEIYQGSVNIGSWTPVGNYFGVAAYTGGSTAQNWVRQLRIDW